MVVVHLHTHVDDVSDFFIQYFDRQAESGYVVAHQATGDSLCLENGALVTQRHQVVGYRQGGATRTNQGDFLAVLFFRGGGQTVRNVSAVICGDSFQPANGHRLFIHPHTAASRLTGSVANPTEDGRKNVAFPVDHIGIAEAALGNQPDVFGDIGVCGTGPLAVHHLMEIFRIRSVGAFHFPFDASPFPGS